MASYRRPKGAVVRPIPDWNVQRLFYGGIQNGFVSAQNYTDGFTNRETDGSSLIVWDCTIAIGRFTAATYTLATADWFIAQLPAPGTTAPFGPVDPTIGGINSVLAHNYDTSSLPGGLPVYNVLSGEGIWRWPNPFPLAIVRPGFSFLVQFVFTNGTAAMSVIVERASFP